MFAIAALISFAFAYFLEGTGDHTGTWDSPTALTILGLALIATHLVLGSGWPRSRP